MTVTAGGPQESKGPYVLQSQEVLSICLHGYLCLQAQEGIEQFKLLQGRTKPSDGVEIIHLRRKKDNLE